nr:nucleoside recognition domain-containing protein [Maliibacterium massiliense]
MGVVEQISGWMVPVVLLGVTLVAVRRKTGVYSAFVEGAGEGFQTAVRIMPYVVATLMLVSMLRASGGLAFIEKLLAPVFGGVGMPKELVGFTVMRPLSGSGALALLADMQQQYGVDSIIARTAAVMMGSSETLFYTLAVYFGAVGVKKTRYALPAALLATIAGYLAAAWICRAFFG